MIFTKTRIVPAVIALVNALLLVKIFYLWRFSYFSLDDFNNLYWVQQQNGWQMFWHNINPFSTFFRPFGMLVYWICWRFFDLNATPYHLIALGLHVVNVCLLYYLLSKISGSKFGAAVGALLFGLRANFAELYWNFGAIFELLACALIFLVLSLHMTGERNFGKILAVCGLTVLAIKSKEMAIMLPAVLLAYDVSQNRHFDRKAILEFAILALIAVWFAQLKISTMAGDAASDPYYLDLRALIFGRGYGWYFDRLYGIRLRWGAWMGIATGFSLWMAYKREKRGLFFLAYVFITLLPVVFLVNHRSEFYWYIPFFGFSGLIAIAVAAIGRRLEKFVPTMAPAIGLLLFVVLGYRHYTRETQLIAQAIPWQRSLSQEYAAFVNSLRALPRPAPQETIYYRTFPRFFSQESLLSATQVAFHRVDLRVQAGVPPSASCGYCLQFVDGSVKMDKNENEK